MEEALDPGAGMCGLKSNRVGENMILTFGDSYLGNINFSLIPSDTTY